MIPNNLKKPILIDTDVLSYIYNEHSLARDYKDVLQDFQGFIALQSVAEMQYGAFLGKWGQARFEKLEKYLANYETIEPTTTTAVYWAQLQVQVRTVGRHIAPGDAWIAATALEHDLALVTHNVKDFESVQGLQIISLNPKNETTKKP
jgi:tRNA(fMet)-specific endonuclease VapC